MSTLTHFPGFCRPPAGRAAARGWRLLALAASFLVVAGCQTQGGGKAASTSGTDKVQQDVVDCLSRRSVADICLHGVLKDRKVDLNFAMPSLTDDWELPRRMTPLTYAARFSYPEVVMELLKAGADVTVTASDGSNAIANAGWGCNFIAIPELLAAKADPNSRGPFDYTALHAIADRTNCADDSPRGFRSQLLAWQLIAAGADLTLQSKKGSTPAVIAEKFNRTDLVSIFTRAGNGEKLRTEDLDLLFYTVSINKPQTGKRRYYLERIRGLIQKGANVNFLFENFLSPLAVAEMSGDREVVAILEQAGATRAATAPAFAAIQALRNDPDHRRRMNGMLVNAAQKRETGRLAFALKWGADPNATVSGTTPMAAAVKSGDSEIIGMLAESGAALTGAPAGGSGDMLLDAAEKDMVGAGRALLQSGASPDALLAAIEKASKAWDFERAKKLTLYAGQISLTQSEKFKKTRTVINETHAAWKAAEEEKERKRAAERAAAIAAEREAQARRQANTSQDNRNSCIAQVKRNESWCYQVNGSDARNSCIAQIKGSDTWCYQISDRDEQNSCIAQAKRSDTWCYQIGSRDKQNSCIAQVKRSDTWCYQISDENEKNACIALTKGNESWCYQVNN